jgi:RNA polymerase sigma-70 factor (ECF subfamily)
VADPGEDDATFVARLREGDPAAFERLVRTHVDALVSVARRLLQSPADAEEVVQEAFLAAFAAAPSFRGDAKLGTWLHRIVLNAALQRLRKADRRPKEVAIDELLPEYDDAGHASRIEPAWDTPLDGLVQRAETREAVRRMIDALPTSHRIVLVLRDIEELSTKETADLLDVSPSVVKTRLHRARMALRELIARELSPRPSGPELSVRPFGPESAREEPSE